MTYTNSRGKAGIALLSFAHVHQFHWADTLAGDARAQIVGFWDRDVHRGRSVHEKTGLQFYPILSDLLDHKDVTAAAICSETSEHARLISECCRRGMPVMCEKPTGRNAAEVESIRDEVLAADIPFLQVFPQRLMPGNIRIKEILASGALGRVTHVRKRHGHAFGLQSLAIDMPWVVDPKLSGGGAYMDEGVHEADLLGYYFGMPISVSARASSSRCGGGEMAATALFEFPGDITVVHEAGWNWIAGGPTTEIYGERGILIGSQTDCASTTGVPLVPHLSIFQRESESWKTLEESFDFSTTHRRFPVAFLDMLVDGRAPVATIDDGLRAARMVDGVYRSIERQRTMFY